MDGVGAGVPRHLQYGIDIEIGVGGTAFAQGHGFIRFQHMGQFGIVFRVDGHGGNLLLATGANNAAGNFAAVGNQYLVDHCASRHQGSRFSRKALRPSRPSSADRNSAISSAV